MEEIKDEFIVLAPLSSPEISVEDFILYIQQELPLFVSSQTYRKIITPKKNNETHHTTALTAFLLKSQSKYTIIAENAQKGRSKADMVVYNRQTDEVLLIIETKRLPIPKGKDREKNEYVYTKKNNGGIERFKTGQHGVDNQERLLPENMMVAYIEEQDYL
jgi:hypothetical protein